MIRGAEQLIALRKRRKVPGLVILDADAEPLPFADWLIEPSSIAHLQAAPGQSAQRADLRCVVGLTVYVSGLDASRVHALRDAAIAAGAKRVIASVQQQIGFDEWIAFKTIEVTDTAGHHG